MTEREQLSLAYGLLQEVKAARANTADKKHCFFADLKEALLRVNYAVILSGRTDNLREEEELRDSIHNMMRELAI